MSWLDGWIKKRNGTDIARSQRKRKSRRNSPGASTRSESREAEHPPRRQVREHLTVRQARLPRLVSGFPASMPTSKIATPDPAKREVPPIDLETKAVEAKEESEPPLKVPSRIATVHLLSGETIERVAFCVKEKAKSICEGLGFDGIDFFAICLCLYLLATNFSAINSFGKKMGGRKMRRGLFGEGGEGDLFSCEVDP